jgi:hypothetical protein
MGFWVGLRLRSGLGMFMIDGLRGKGLKLWFVEVVVFVVLLLLFRFFRFRGTFRAQTGGLVERVGVDDPVTLVTGMAAARAAALA